MPTNTIYTQDNLPILQKMDSSCIDLIYLDPPFNSNKTHVASAGSKADGALFRDVWTLSDIDVAWRDIIAKEHPSIIRLLDIAGQIHSLGMQAYLTMMAIRLLEMHRVLKDTGSIYLHCDPEASHYLKTLLDGVFEQANFRNEIVWCYLGGGIPKRDFPRKHDIIFRYSKTNDYVFNRDEVRVPYDSNYKATVFAGDDTRAPGKIYTRHSKGKIVEDWWRDFPRPYGKDQVDYPTQKPLELLERIITASSNLDDIVLDPFCGSGTSLIAAQKLGREWIGIDRNPEATSICQERFINETNFSPLAQESSSINMLEAIA